MKRITVIVFVFAFCVFSGQPCAAAIYKYVDKNGTPSFVDSLDSVPEKYRKSAVLVSGKPEGPKKQPSEKETKPERPEKSADAKQGKALFFSREKMREFAGPSFDKRLIVSGAVLAAFVIFFVIAGKIGKTLNRKWISPVLRVVLTAGVLVYLFCVFAKEAGTVFSMVREFEEDILGSKSRVEERSKTPEAIEGAPQEDKKSQ